jgi:hypothetical protein
LFECAEFAIPTTGTEVRGTIVFVATFASVAAVFILLPLFDDSLLLNDDDDEVEEEAALNGVKEEEEEEVVEECVETEQKERN